MQSIIFGVAVYVIMTLMGFTIILAALAPLVGLVAFVLGLYTMWKAYNNVEYELPVIGKYARDMVNKPQQ